MSKERMSVVDNSSDIHEVVYEEGEDYKKNSKKHGVSVMLPEVNA